MDYELRIHNKSSKSSYYFPHSLSINPFDIIFFFLFWIKFKFLINKKCRYYLNSNFSINHVNVEESDKKEIQKIINKYVSCVYFLNFTLYTQCKILSDIR